MSQSSDLKTALSDKQGADDANRTAARLVTLREAFADRFGLKAAGLLTYEPDTNGLFKVSTDAGTIWAIATEDIDEVDVPFWRMSCYRARPTNRWTKWRLRIKPSKAMRILTGE